MYARQLADYAEKAKDDLLIVMRVYFEKPRTTVGWKGLINDPDMNGTYQINRGLKMARKLLLDVTELGLPTAGEFLGEYSDTRSRLPIVLPRPEEPAVSWAFGGNSRGHQRTERNGWIGTKGRTLTPDRCHFPSVPGRPVVVGRYRRAHDREPGPP